MEQLKWELFEPVLGEWARYFKPFFESKKAWDIYQKLKAENWNFEKNEPKKPRVDIYPIAKNTYRAFQLCPPDKLQVIFYGSDPYPNRYKGGVPQATGLALDCSNSLERKCQPSLVAFWQGIANEYKEDPVLESDLTYLAQQGVLLTNRALTAEYMKIGKHGDWWDDFQQFFLQDVIQPHFPGIPIVFMGKDAAKLEKWVFKMSNPTFIIDHPSFAARTGMSWDTKGVFHAINRIIEENNGPIHTIKWNRKEFDKQINEVPF